MRYCYFYFCLQQKKLESTKKDLTLEVYLSTVFNRRSLNPRSLAFVDVYVDFLLHFSSLSQKDLALEYKRPTSPQGALGPVPTWIIRIAGVSWSGFVRVHTVLLSLLLVDRVRLSAH
uniref:Uncharacterized protein n=1 Tax=Steinernema glaseri TaxID=37863 RepID=A0A1I7ZDQ8_9BILA